MRPESNSNQGLKGHLVLLTVPTWGTLRPLCGVACRAVQERPDIVVTFMTLGGLHKKITAECDRYSRSNSNDEEKEQMRKRLRLVNIGGQGLDMRELVSVALESFPDCYRKLVLCESIRSSTGDVIPPTIGPTAVITHLSYLHILRSVREITGKDVLVWTWWPAAAYQLLRAYGPERYGGLGDVANKARQVAETTGRDVEQVTKEMMDMKQGNLVVLPGHPAFYDYEWYPQSDDCYKGLRMGPYDFFKMGAEFMKECDGVICNSCSSYEPEAIYATRRWFEESGGQQLYTIGPDTVFGPSEDGLLATDHEVPEYDTPVRAFMDRILASHGEKSLLYISFGTMWWPKSDHVRLYIEILLEHEIPFIFATASPHVDLPTELIEMISGSKFAMISKWCPQQMILSHPATGWSLTHCGHNSVIEALSRGIPMIAWPLVYDQPGNAAYISLSMDVAFELIQVRTGIEGLKRLHRGGDPPVGTCESVAAEARDVLRRMKGSEGDRKRRNAEIVRDKLSRVWNLKNAGDGLVDLKRLLHAATKD